MPGDEVIGDPFQPFLFEVWRWLPHMPRHCINTLRGIVKCRANSTTASKIAVRQVKPFEVGRERAMLREDNILSNPNCLGDQSLQRNEDIQSKVKAHLTSLTATFFEKRIGNLVYRFDKCLKLHGDYAEK
ncbi:hypothetical protein AVEN_209937-1 [Araneus ventricosus]|uniref:Uncharacterized protein n=1 Tax=Araneus ventricosus TaxID=182803 RepID=A0A4Y2DB78_ARAVE|nr:hypothetical protein AVEN_209937-1 [Araneus ventricosus]